MVEELKLCPWCRGKAVMRKDDDPGYPWYVTFDHDADCVMFAVPTDMFRSFASEQDAVKAWTPTPDGTSSGEEVREAVARVISLAKGQPETGQTSVGAWWWDARHDRARPEHFEGECRDEDRAHADTMIPMLQAIFATPKRDEEQAGEEAIRADERERCAKFIEANIRVQSSDDQHPAYWSVRRNGNTYGVEYAEAIRALAAAHKEQS